MQKVWQTTRPCTLIAFFSEQKYHRRRHRLSERKTKTHKSMDSCIFLNCKCQLLSHNANGAIIIVRQFVFNEWIVQAKLKHVLRNSQRIWNAIHNWKIQHEHGITSKIIDKRSNLLVRICSVCWHFISVYEFFHPSFREKKQKSKLKGKIIQQLVKSYKVSDSASN